MLTTLSLLEIHLADHSNPCFYNYLGMSWLLLLDVYEINRFYLGHPIDISILAYINNKARGIKT
jgi:hypothetical protein